MVELIFVENKSLKMVSIDYLSRTVEPPQGSIWMQYKWIYLWIFKSCKLSKTLLEFCIAGLMEFVGQICPQSSVPFFLLGRLERSWQSPMQPLSDMQSGFATKERSHHDPTSKLSFSCSILVGSSFSITMSSVIAAGQFLDSNSHTTTEKVPSLNTTNFSCQDLDLLLLVPKMHL